MGGLSAAIGLASLCMAMVPALLFGAFGYFAFRKTRFRWIAAVLAAIFGVAAGALAITATFFESTFDPPKKLVFDVPAGFSHETVVLIVDPTVHTQVSWTGAAVPLVERHGRLAIPRSGVVRVHDIDWIYDAQVDTTLCTGVINTARSHLDDPGLGVYVVYGFTATGSPVTEPDFSTLDPAARVALVRAREAER